MLELRLDASGEVTYAKDGVIFHTSTTAITKPLAIATAITTSTAATTAKQLRMVRVAEDPENKDQTAANCSVVVKVNLHQYTVGSLATGI